MTTAKHTAKSRYAKIIAAAKGDTATLAQLDPAEFHAALMVSDLLDGKPHCIALESNHAVRLCVDVATKIGATVTDNRGRRATTHNVTDHGRYVEHGFMAYPMTRRNRTQETTR